MMNTFYPVEIFQKKLSILFIIFQTSIELAKKISKAQTDEEFFKLVKIVPSALSYGVSCKYSIQYFIIKRLYFNSNEFKILTSF